MDDSKFSALLIFFISNYFLTCLIIGLLAGVISLINKPKPLRINVVAEALFSYYLLFTIGINNLVNFVFHVFFGDMAAKFIGWEQSPFQAEVGFASLGVGIAGVIAFKASLPFRFATLIPPSIFSLAMEPIAQALKPARSSSSDIGPAHHHSIGDAPGRTKRRDHSSSKQMSKKTKFIEVVTGEKIEGDFDPTRAIKGTIIPPAGSAEVAGRSSEAPFMFECAWCGAINHAERRDSALYICFACGRPMRPALS